MPQILIVEDHPRVARLLEKGLGQHGFDTAVAKDGEEALQRIQHDHYDLMLLDINLPGKDGWSVLKELRQQGSHLPVIVVSARSDIPETIAKTTYTVDGYLSKPFKIRELVTQVQETLSQC